MGKNSNIAWTDHTVNAWIGCQKVSAGCENCYASKSRFVQGFPQRLWGPPKTSTRYETKRWEPMLRKLNRDAGERGESERVFMHSMSDFCENHPIANEIRPRVWDVIRECRNLDFLLLTKHPDRWPDCLPRDWGSGWYHVWLGTSIEDMNTLHRLVHMDGIPAAVKFVSYEPALGPIPGEYFHGVDWVIYGGESGSNRRPDNIAWAEGVHYPASRIGYAFFYKQESAYRSGSLPDHPMAQCQEFPKPRRQLKVP